MFIEFRKNSLNMNMNWYEQWQKFIAKIHANLVFQAWISFLRRLWTPGTTIRKVLVHTEKTTLSCPLLALNMQISMSFRSRSDLVLDADHSLDFLELKEPISRNLMGTA